MRVGLDPIVQRAYADDAGNTTTRAKSMPPGANSSRPPPQHPEKEAFPAGKRRFYNGMALNRNDSDKNRSKRRKQRDLQWQMAV